MQPPSDKWHRAWSYNSRDHYNRNRKSRAWWIGYRAAPFILGLLAISIVVAIVLLGKVML